MRYFIRARIQRDAEGYAVVTTGTQGSDILRSMVRANGLIILPEEATIVKKGSTVTVQLLDDSLERMPALGY
jgi:molybdopterin molybdotransferase